MYLLRYPGTFTCTGSGDISVYPKENNGTYSIGYCEDSTNCEGTKQELSGYTNGSTAIMSAPSGSTKIDDITTALREIMTNDSVDSSTALTTLMQIHP